MFEIFYGIAIALLCIYIYVARIIAGREIKSAYYRGYDAGVASERRHQTVATAEKAKVDFVQAVRGHMQYDAATKTFAISEDIFTDTANAMGLNREHDKHHE